MSFDLSRRRLVQGSLASSGLILLAQAAAVSGEEAPSSTARGSSARTDFDFFIGEWRVEHRRLAKRLVNSNDWEEFEGTTRCFAILGGYANLNDSLVRRPSGTARGMGLRAFDAATHRWRDWYLDGRAPTSIEVHGVGDFKDGVGTFIADDVHEGRPIKVRGIWSRISQRSFRWEQAYSADGGLSWETNYVMQQIRTT